MRALVSSVVVIAACSRPVPHHAPVRPAPPTPTPVEAPQAALVVDEEEVVDEDLDGKLEEAVVRGTGIDVAVSWWTQTGNTHVAASLTITTATGKLELAASEDEESAEELPLVDRIYPLAADRWVLLGWSSYGSGMQTTHAWLVDGSSTPRVVDKVSWTTDRRHAGFALNASRTIEIGVPLPANPNDLHDPAGWMLVHGANTFALDKVRKLPRHRIDLASLNAYYTPPFGDQPTERGWSGNFIWLVADKTFKVQRL